MTEHSEKFEIVKKYYRNHIWTKKKVYAAVGHWITAEEYEEITGEEYTGE